MSKSDRIEREAKFQLSPDQDPTKFAEILVHDGYTVRSLGTVDITDTYLDTPSYALLRHGLALRVRHGIAAHEVGIKALTGTRKGSSLNRLDIAFPLAIDADPLDATTWPTAVFDELKKVVAVKPKTLQPLVVVRQRRAKSHIHPTREEESAAWLAEWSEDEVWLDEERDDEERGEWLEGQDAQFAAHFNELEVEMLPTRGPSERQNGNEGQANHAGLAHVDPLHIDGERAAFDAFVTQVQAQFNLIPIYHSKFVRGLEQRMARMHGGTQHISPTMSLTDASRLLLHQQLMQIMLNEPGVRGGKKARYVHNMRVAIRRARAALRLGALRLPPKEVKRITKGLKRLNLALAAVRDLDVMLANLRAFARNQPEHARRGFKRLRAELKVCRKDARTKLIALLDSKRHHKFIVACARFCASPTEIPSENGYRFTPSQIRHTIPSRIWAAFEAVRAYELAFEKKASPAPETLHALRIETKYLRYLIEFTQPLLGRDGDLLAEQLHALQEHLGELNDAYIEAQRWAAWDARVEDGDGLHTAIASRRVELSARIGVLGQTVPLADFISPHNRLRLATVLAAI